MNLTEWKQLMNLSGNAINIDDIPSEIDVAPVRHGSWIPVEDDDMFCYCSECGTHEYRETIEVLRYDYCPYCGAKMDGAERKTNDKIN